MTLINVARAGALALGLVACGAPNQDSIDMKEQLGGGGGNVCGDLVAADRKECETNVPRVTCQIAKTTIEDEKLRGLDKRVDRLLEHLERGEALEITGATKDAKGIVFSRGTPREYVVRDADEMLAQNFFDDRIDAKFWDTITWSRSSKDGAPAIKHLKMHLQKPAGSETASLEIVAAVYREAGSFTAHDGPLGKVELRCAFNDAIAGP